MKRRCRRAVGALFYFRRKSGTLRAGIRIAAALDRQACPRFFFHLFLSQEALMSTPAQIAANQKNAQHSTGPKSEGGKAASCQNNFRHGFAGAFRVLPSEDIDEFKQFDQQLNEEHQPVTPTETLLVTQMAQSWWLRQRALLLQNTCFADDSVDQKQLALFLRYQTANDRVFHKALNELLKLRAEKRKAEIGFESQQREQSRA